jgi:hypothetical protein
MVRGCDFRGRAVRDDLAVIEEQYAVAVFLD